MTDRRRINGPLNGTTSPFFASSLDSRSKPRSAWTPRRTRNADELRKIFLKIGLTPSAAGSAYLEIERPQHHISHSLARRPSSLKLSCTVHGPKPLPRSTPFSSSLQTSTYVKFAPFAARQRRGYIRDSRERDLSVHLETALKGVIIGERWPKSGLDIIVTVLEGEDEGDWGDELAGGAGTPGWGMMNVLAGCITVASAALADARVDCLDMVAGGVAAIVEGNNLDGPEVDQRQTTNLSQRTALVLDPCPADHGRILAACVVGYLHATDEITELWVKGDIPCGKTMAGLTSLDSLMQGAVEAATASRTVLGESVKESAVLLVESLIGEGNAAASTGNRKAMEEDHDRMEE